jgi:hypothetical protein
MGVWYWRTTAWPLPREISHRLIGTVSTNATALAVASDAQNTQLDMPASTAPGTASMTALSMISITVMDPVPAAGATFSAVLTSTPARSTPHMVRA